MGIKMKRCVIVGGGEIQNLSYDRRLIQEDDFIIAADRGYAHCQAMGLQPDLLLGDFDSYKGELAAACPILEYPVEKDDTDTMLAIKVALEKGFQDLLLLGMTGGRLDHSIANIQSLVYAVIHGAKACLMDEDLWISVITGGQQITVPYREGFVLSVFAHSDRCSGVCLRDLFYPLENGVITNTFPLGVSNHFLPGKDGKIAIEEGIAVIICNREL
ncbi:MAG: thiamine diphosphokinase [Negativibacillus sp.]